MSDLTPALHVLWDPRAPYLPLSAGSRVKRLRERGKKPTTALRAGSASFPEVSQKKPGSHYGCDLVLNVTKQLWTSRQGRSLLLHCGKKVWGLVLNKKPFDQLNSRHSGQVPTWQHQCLLPFLLLISRSVWRHSGLIHVWVGFNEGTSRCVVFSLSTESSINHRFQQFCIFNKSLMIWWKEVRGSRTYKSLPKMNVR